MTQDERLIQITPTQRQLKHQQLEFYAFIHFTVNAFTDREWGDGTESPSVFNPEKLNAEQWAEAIAAAGMKGLILTCKHHDGFCLWPSRYTKHSVASSPYKNGAGDVVKEAANACRKYGLAFGIYLSPWDRNCPLYGTGKEYDDYFIAQLTELLTGYGPIFSVWFDGACGEGPNGRKQIYDWPRYYDTVRKLQPEACISVCGPDVRWCGNEGGHTRESEWSVVPARLSKAEAIKDKSQQKDDPAFRLQPIKSSDQDLGSREKLRDEPDLIWYPAEVNTSIRPGWFWHASENDKVKSLAELTDIYFRSVGANATFLLNIPPTNEGLLHKNDVRRLIELGAYLKNAFANEITQQAELTADSAAEGCDIHNALTDGYDTCYVAAKATAEICITLPKEETLCYLTLKENIRMSQRIERFTVDIGNENGFQEAFTGTVVGYQRIVPLYGVRAKRLRIRITDARVAPTLARIALYKA